MIDWDFVKEVTVSTVAFVVSVFVGIAMITLFVAGAGALLGAFRIHNTWGDSAEFSQLATGQERFSEHATNVGGLTVVVDHETGVQYLADGHGMTPLLSADGTPLLVAEAGS